MQAMGELLTAWKSGERDPDVLTERIAGKLGTPRYIVSHAIESLSALVRLFDGRYGQGCEDSDEYCDAILKVIKKLCEGAVLRDAQQYLKRAIHNERINTHRKARTACVSLDAINIPPPDHSSTASYEELQGCASSWLEERGYKALAAVAQDPDRLYKDIAEELGLSPSSFSRKVTKERLRLKKEEQDFLDSLPPHERN